MPDRFKHAARTVRVDRGPYSMKMEDGENAEITMYGEVMETRPKNWRTGEAINVTNLAGRESGAPYAMVWRSHG